MAQLEVEPKKKSNWWIWVLVIAVVLIAWYLISGDRTHVDDTVPMTTDSVGMTTDSIGMTTDSIDMRIE